MKPIATNAPNKTGHGRMHGAYAGGIKPFALALGLAAPLLSVAPGCIHLEGAPGPEACESKSTSDVSSRVTKSKAYAFRDAKLYVNGRNELCPQSDAATLVEFDLSGHTSAVVAENAGPISNIDGPYVLALSGPYIKNGADSCTIDGLTPLTIYDSDKGTVIVLPIKANVAWVSGTLVAYEADDGEGRYDVYIHDFVTGGSGRLVQGMRLVQEGMPFNGKVLYAYNDTGLYSVDVMTSKQTLQNADKTIVPYLAGDLVALHDKTRNTVTFSRTPESALFDAPVAEAWLSPRPVAVFNDYVVVIRPDMGVDVMNLDPDKFCGVTIPFAELTEGHAMPADISGFGARLLPAGQDSFVYELSRPGSGEGCAALIKLK